MLVLVLTQVVLLKSQLYCDTRITVTRTIIKNNPKIISRFEFMLKLMLSVFGGHL